VRIYCEEHLYSDDGERDMYQWMVVLLFLAMGALLIPLAVNELRGRRANYKRYAWFLFATTVIIVVVIRFHVSHHGLLREDNLFGIHLLISSGFAISTVRFLVATYQKPRRFLQILFVLWVLYLPMGATGIRLLFRS
jgi:hypothetical protein